MFSNIADSSNAGFIVADSMKSSALVVMSANLRNHRIFSRISTSLCRAMFLFFGRGRIKILPLGAQRPLRRNRNCLWPIWTGRYDMDDMETGQLQFV